jgi:hypothetical protein
MTKFCTKCHKTLSEDKFNWKYKDIRRAPHCQECSRAYIRQHYKNNQLYYLKKAQRRSLLLKETYHKYIGDYLTSHSCVDCGENDILVLEFDHKDRKTKRIEVSRVINQGLSLLKLKEEISKCDVRCANCHRKKTAKESESWRLKYAPVA